MAWQNFPIDEDNYTGRARLTDAYNELRQACTERGLGTPIEMVTGRRFYAPYISSLQAAITTNISTFVKVVSDATNNWDIRQYGMSLTRQDPCPAIGYQNVFTDVFGAGVTNWPRIASGGRSPYVGVLNDCYRVLDKLRIKRYAINGTSSARDYRQFMTFAEPFTWGDLKNAINAAAWQAEAITGSNCFYQCALWYGGIKTANMSRHYAATVFGPILDVQPFGLTRVCVKMDWFSQYFSPSFTCGFEFRQGNSANPPNITDARNYGSRIFLENRTGGLISETEYRVLSFNGSEQEPSETTRIVSVLPVQFDAFESWDLPGPPNNGSDDEGWGNAYCAGSPQWLLVQHQFDKMS